MRVIKYLSGIFVVSLILNQIIIFSNFRFIKNSIPECANTIIIGSSRTHHNFNTELIPDSIYVLSKPNLYAIDQYNILRNIDFEQNNISYLFLELQEENISNSSQQTMFWDISNLPEILRFTESKTIALANSLSTFGILKFVQGTRGFSEERILNIGDIDYPDMVNKTDSSLKEYIIEFYRDSLLIESSQPIVKHNKINYKLYSELLDDIDDNVDIMFYSPFGIYKPSKQDSLKAPILELRDCNWSYENIYDFRHLTKSGADKQTNKFISLIQKSPNAIDTNVVSR